jgi:hypothetical protein
MNLYGYVVNDPVNLQDPAGLLSTSNSCPQYPPPPPPPECGPLCECAKGLPDYVKAELEDQYWNTLLECHWANNEPEWACKWLAHLRLEGALRNLCPQLVP